MLAAESPVLHMTYAGVDAYAQEINGEFVVFKDSTVRKKHVQSLASYHAQTREQLFQEGKLTNSENPDFWILTQNIPFQSISTAASIIGGVPLNGRIIWKLKGSDQTYADWQQVQIDQAEKKASGNR